jgi:methyl-accepting chemotaxis protein
MNQDTDERAFIAVSEANHASFPTLRRLIERYAPKALEKLYTQIAQNPKTAQLLPTQQKRDYASNAQLKHWLALFSGRFGTEQLASSEKIGRVHSRIGLTPTYYIGGYALVLEEVIGQAIRRANPLSRLFGRKLSRDVGTLVKVALLDMDGALGAYFRAEEEARTAVTDSLGRALAAVASGDLRAQLDELPPAYRQMELDFHDMRRSVSRTVEEMAISANNIDSGASQINSAAHDLANRTEHQAASIARTAEVMRSVNSGVQVTAENVRSVNASIADVNGQARGGGEVADQAIEAMDKIKASSTEIAQITEVIETIAFQTNLLALNAGVEAARAGDSGKGFAVVASEVGALARRTTDSAKSIKDLIAKSGADVLEGADLVVRTRNALEEIIDKIGDATNRAEEIAAQAGAQAASLQEVSDEIQRMDSNTQQNAAMAEQSNAAARALSEEASRMASVVAHFKLERREKPREEDVPSIGRAAGSAATDAPARKIANSR